MFMSKIKRIATILLCCCLMSLSFSHPAFAAENTAKEYTASDACEIIEVVEANEGELSAQVQATNSTTLADFSGVYYGWLDVPFTVTDSSRTVKVMFSVRSLDGSEMITYTGIRKSSGSLWFWTQNNQSGNSHIYTVGKMQTGDYVLRIKTNQTGAGYAISGQVYYFI